VVLLTFTDRAVGIVRRRALILSRQGVVARLSSAREPLDISQMLCAAAR
jgi:hypothetical protein